MFNKIAGAVLGTLLVLVALRIVAEGLFGPDEPAVVQTAGNDDGTATPAADAGDAQLLTLIAAQDPADGQVVAARCAGCHTFGDGEAHGFGPNLYNVVGGPIAHEADYTYTAALEAHHDAGETWTYENLNAFLTSPQTFAPGTAMSFPGVPDDTDRAKLIAYLRSLSATPVALDVPAAGAAGGAGGDVVADAIAAADPVAGQQVAARCAGCHTFGEGEAHGFGPNLYNVVGGPIGHEEDFTYTAAIEQHHDAGETWTYDALDAFLTSPQTFAPGTAMTFPGVPNETDRHNLIAYLRTLSESPVPLPEAAAPAAEATAPAAAAPEATPAAEAPAAAAAPAEAAAPAAAADNAEDPAVVARVAAADPAAGQQPASVCGGCHSLDAGGGTLFGPNLYGVVGGPVGHVDGFSYSPTLAQLHDAGALWTFTRLDDFLTSPSAFAPGTMMAFPGFSNEQDRANVIAYLNTLSDAPLATDTGVAAAGAAAPGAEATAPAPEAAAPAAATPEAATPAPEAAAPAAATPEAAAPTPEAAAPAATTAAPAAETAAPAATAPAAEAIEAAPAVELAYEDRQDPALLTRIAGGDAAAGEAVALQCSGCHTFGDGEAHGFGPNLYGVVYGPVAHEADFTYTAGFTQLHDQGAIWTYAGLDAFLTHPADVVPGTMMAFPGLADANDRANVIAYLRSLSANPAPVAYTAVPTP